MNIKILILFMILIVIVITSEDAVFLTLIINCVSVLLDIIILAIHYPSLRSFNDGGCDLIINDHNHW